MKNMILGTILSVMGIVVVAIIMAVVGRFLRDTELSEALSQSVENAVEITMEQKNYDIDSNEAFVSDFIVNLLCQVENDADIEVDVAGADYEKGILSINVIESYTNMLGGTSKLSYATTVIMEQSDDTYYEVSYMYDEEHEYESYMVPHSEKTTVPKDPACDINGNGRFLYWATEPPKEGWLSGLEASEKNGWKKADIPETVEEDLTFYAVFMYEVKYLLRESPEAYATRNVMEYDYAPKLQYTRGGGSKDYHGNGTFAFWSFTGFGGGEADFSKMPVTSDMKIYSVFRYVIGCKTSGGLISISGLYGEKISPPSMNQNAIKEFRYTSGVTGNCRILANLPDKYTEDAKVEVVYKED